MNSTNRNFVDRFKFVTIFILMVFIFSAMAHAICAVRIGANGTLEIKCNDGTWVDTGTNTATTDSMAKHCADHGGIWLGGTPPTNAEVLKFSDSKGNSYSGPEAQKLFNNLMSGSDTGVTPPNEVGSGDCTSKNKDGTCQN